MKRMIISIVIEGKEERLNEVKSQIIRDASETLLSCTTNIYEEPNRKEINPPRFAITQL